MSHRSGRFDWKPGVAAAAFLIVISMLAGCEPNATGGGASSGSKGPDEGTPVTETQGPKPDPTAELVTIDSTLKPQPLKVEVYKKEAVETRDDPTKKDGLQWYNASDSTVVVIIEDGPVGIEIPPGAYSHVHRVNKKAGEGVYDYSISRGAWRPPDTPQIDVGP